ncbi:MAG: UDP-N-acetylmuramate dehydrogenase [Lachnospiraceae bacterium]|nr:UDP-N-acetylmuramate dehydrogenase [Lachnospiraceae bacterium]
MITQDTISLIKSINDVDLKCDEDMSLHTTLKMGGKAHVFVTVKTMAALGELIRVLESVKSDYFLLGNGSNILVSDKGLDIPVIRLAGDFDKVTAEGDMIKAGAAALLSSVARTALDNSLTGLEFASGIPGSVGGAMVMNAGAYGGEMKDAVVSVKVMDENGDVSEYSNEDMAFGYRDSILKRRKLIVIETVFKLNKGDKESIKNTMDELNKKRREKQPLEYPSAGSTFKRPEGYFAAKLIEDAGLKGYTVGGACVSEKHAGFCVNKDNGTASDFYKLMSDVKDRVYKDSGVTLEPEVIMLGEF